MTPTALITSMPTTPANSTSDSDIAVKHEVTFQPSGRRSEFEMGTTLLDAAQTLGVEIRSDCGGQGTCGKCRIIVVEGWEGLPPPTGFERKVLGDSLSGGYRLACRTPLPAEVQVMVPQESRVQRVVILTGAEARPLELEPMVRKYHLEVDPPSLADPLGDAERLLKALMQTYGLRGVELAYPVLRELPRTLRDARWDVTATVWDWGKPTIIDVEAGYVEKSYGVAVDIGTTTVVGYLTELDTGQVVATESMANPQIAFGEDVMARISYTMEKTGGRQQMREAILQGLNQIISRACAEAEVNPQQVAEMTVVGNTAMHHLFLGIEAGFVAKAPFPPAMHRHYDLKAQDLGLEINPAANVHILPIEAGFVGADNVGALIATEPYNEEKVTLLIDIGTNGELVLGNRELGLIACSVAAGPAFEGACIQFGMRAAVGAIEHVRIEPHTFGVECEVIGDVPARGICGSGIIDAVAQMLRAGVISPDGRMATDIPSPRLRFGDNGDEFVLVWGEQAALDQDIVITQQDVREVQLAKGAFHAGAQVLMKHIGVERIEKVLLAGAFGSYVDPASAMAIGLFPQCDPDSVSAVGNAAGHGARMALLNRRKRAEAIKIARQVQYIELTADPDFQTRFVEGTLFPAPVPAQAL